MEGAMSGQNDYEAKYPTLDIVLSAIAAWVNRYRRITGANRLFGDCSPDDVRQIASDLGMPAAELRALASKGPQAADLLEKLLIALCVDPETLAKTNPATMRDLQRLCIACNHKSRCQHELAQGTAAEHFHDFCPNAFTIDALFSQKKTLGSRH
jgi:hypothetical protein